ncbi:hypothetical protein CONPUDRAFT_96559 [Coniophora puteana RWD-64-598 SS2]|uniref:BTB domain-containing protein n=1 Tax=Coniophora puteana (strain RWD-64-598) TaxID=741705 RepID=A0A5M3N8Q6_CONPW|nr:uncharacterized protein CONPUDRAFT_96559 [Coniophora puteana RWD-64-598 SS2]EIW87225.1 hypothetical protein CONPUDRAFT_96559 [Coniophora puteana RWD-64-598 SS2]
MTRETPRLKRDRSLWYEDGNMVIAAAPSDTKKGLLFRVHKFILAMHSPVFADMFTLPDIPAETADPEDFYDGVPLVRMYDKAQDVKDLLKYYYEPSSFVVKRYDPQNPNKIRGLMHLARKYQITPLLDRLIKHLKEDWPQTLTEWDVIEGEVKARLESQVDYGYDDHVYVDEVFPEPGTTIRLAREMDIPVVLPAVFYHLSRLKITRERTSEITDFKIIGGRTADWSALSEEDLRCLLYGRENLQEYKSIACRPLIFSCSHKECDALKTLCSAIQVLYDSKDILTGLKDFVPKDQYTQKELCVSCWLKVNNLAQNARMDIWKKLPKFFRLPRPSDDWDSDSDMSA